MVINADAKATHQRWWISCRLPRPPVIPTFPSPPSLRADVPAGTLV